MFLLLHRNGSVSSPKINTEIDIINLIRSANSCISNQNFSEAAKLAMQAMDCCDEVFVCDEIKWKEYYIKSLSVIVEAFSISLGVDETIKLLNSLYSVSEDSQNKLLTSVVLYVFNQFMESDYYVSEKVKRL